jgi:hypothetical protein
VWGNEYATVYNIENGTYNMGLFIKESDRQDQLKHGALQYICIPSSHLAALAAAVPSTRIRLTGIFAHLHNLK